MSKDETSSQLNSGFTGSDAGDELASKTSGSSGAWARETAALEDRGLRWPDLGGRTLAELAVHFTGTPRIAQTLELALKSGLGQLRLDERMLRLPRGLRAWAPILAELAQNPELAEQRWMAPAAGWNPLELPGMASTIEGFASRRPTPIWRENHPAWLPSP